MELSNTKEIQKSLQKELDAKRYQHTLGVAYTAASLAMRYQTDLSDAFIAGLLHDCAKCMSNQDKLCFCKEHDITISESELRNPFLLHATVGSVLAKEKYGIESLEIQGAIRFHTTGKPNMTLLEKIIFIADYIEPNREHDPDLSEIRQLAFIDIDRCLIHILKNTLLHLQNSDKEIDPKTKETYHYYIKEKDCMNE